MNKPLLVALCGVPKSGKSEIQKILCEEFNILIQDDGWILRDFGMQLFGLTLEDVTTQAGKMREIEIDGKMRTVRWMLGELGNSLEAKFGEHVIPNWAIRNAIADKRPSFGHSFGSVRKTQGWAYKNAGGIVVEIVRPGVELTGHNFDTYDRGAVDFTFRNDGDSLHGLRQKVRALFPEYLNSSGLFTAA